MTCKYNFNDFYLLNNIGSESYGKFTNTFFSKFFFTNTNASSANRRRPTGQYFFLQNLINRFF